MEYALFINRDRAVAAGQSAIAAKLGVHKFRTVFTRQRDNVGYVVETYDAIGVYHHTITERELV